jgi:hypothetical protein
MMNERPSTRSDMYQPDAGLVVIKPSQKRHSGAIHSLVLGGLYCSYQVCQQIQWMHVTVPEGNKIVHSGEEYRNSNGMVRISPIFGRKIYSLVPSYTDMY